MSTFNGLVDEFPSIRIDYFRHHPGKVSPQACFLSHVHSDHLQGLESLKMPFVYCSMATKKILLRMEKYPHRINFAKGILEARKQTYRSLRLVLRPLPLETSVEIELGPKSKIRVTLFDANHCPGAVMFLIEGHDNAVLYTGDVRAEPWWVNSIVRNPILLPYSCGAKRLNCIYLDTTFASRDDIYECFPTKADGLKELLTKVSKCPKPSLFYFRSWTLGYEDVWIALSNYLRSRIHVDAYQFRIFHSLADDTSNLDRGPALAGFDCGNQRQLGCLTNDTDVLIHSCEPGTDCHDNIKKHKNVVWITPIISRLKDGTEVAEVGAGGGGGDLYQTPQLEYVDEATMQALEKLCGDSSQLKEAFSRLAQTFSMATARGDSVITLEGLDLNQDEEITLKEFVQLISKKNEPVEKISTRSGERIIHFPYSRHSSFSELRHLVSSFRPMDVCPCTVDLETWSEEVSIQSLFGDLCSDSIFKHDRNTRTTAAERQQASRGKKRKRSRQEQEDSQRTETQKSTESGTEEVYTSAKTSMRRPDYAAESQSHETQQEQQRGQTQKQTASDEQSTQVPSPIRRLHKAVSDRFEKSSEVHPEGNSEAPGIDIDRQYSHEYVATPTPASAPIELPDDEDSEEPIRGNEGDSDSDISLPSSVFDSQPRPDPEKRQDRDTDKSHQSFSRHTPHGTRMSARVAAYRAAKTALDDHDPRAWSDLRLRSVGWRGHTDVEEEL